MSKKEKEDFLSNDIIERLIRVEQRVSKKFGEEVDYDKTEYYKSLSKKEKKDFENYKKTKNVKKLIVMVLLLFPFLAIGMVGFNFTGNVVSDEIGFFGGGFSFIIGFILIVVLFLSLFKVIKKRNRLDRHCDVLLNFKR